MTSFHPSLFAFGLVFITSVTFASDYELITTPPAPKPICTKSLETCKEAIYAVKNFNLFHDLPIYEMKCIPHPNCFSKDSLVIKGYNDK